MQSLLNTALNNEIAAFAADPALLSGLLLIIVVLLISPLTGAATERALT